MLLLLSGGSDLAMSDRVVVLNTFYCALRRMRGWGAVVEVVARGGAL